MIRRGRVSSVDNNKRSAMVFLPDQGNMTLSMLIASGVPDLIPGDNVVVAFLGQSAIDAIVMDKAGPREQRGCLEPIIADGSLLFDSSGDIITGWSIEGRYYDAII